MRRSPLLLVGAAFLTSCREHPAVLSPSSVEAGAIAQLSWVLFMGGAVILLLVTAAAGMAMFGPRAIRLHLAAPRMVIIAGIAFPAIVLSTLLLLNIELLKSAAQPAPDTTNAVRITVTGEQWWWRVVYDGPGGTAVETANEIRIPVGRDVIFTLRSADVIHAFWIPSLAGKVDMIPGRDTRMNVHATRPGVFRGACAEFCGGAHALMLLQVTALEGEAFDAWLRRERNDASLAQNDLARSGATIFASAGCGTCHRVRGTDTNGTIGPDLTHLGARNSIGAGVLPLDGASLARFIVEGQHVKPSNMMPEFRILSAEQIDALVAFLLGLK
jgi:cytochrome c oxidase subunit II